MRTPESLKSTKNYRLLDLTPEAGRISSALYYVTLIPVFTSFTMICGWNLRDDHAVFLYKRSHIHRLYPSFSDLPDDSRLRTPAVYHFARKKRPLDMRPLVIDHIF